MKELMLEHVMWIGRHLGLHWRERQGISFHPSLRFECCCKHKAVYTHHTVLRTLGFLFCPVLFLPSSLFPLLHNRDIELCVCT